MNNWKRIYKNENLLHSYFPKQIIDKINEKQIKKLAVVPPWNLLEVWNNKIFINSPTLEVKTRKPKPIESKIERIFYVSQ